MDSDFTKPIEPFFKTCGMAPCDCQEPFNPEGTCYCPPEDKADGTYWYYQKENQFAIGLLNITLKEDDLLEYPQPEYISINYYNTVSGEDLSPYNRISANYIRGHVSDQDLYRARYHKNVPIHSMELMLMPAFYTAYLKQECPGEFPEPLSAFRSIDGITDFPELIEIMRQIEANRLTGEEGRAFYEQKIREAMAAIVQKTRNDRRFLPVGNMSPEDLKNLDAVKGYLDDHFAFQVNSKQLIDIARMGQTKLRYSFKLHYGYTITEYIQNKRIAHAEYMLLNTAFSIAQVAEAVGYHHAGRFSALFRKNTGFYPEEYRIMLKESNVN